jgi:uncharacterized surface protein with fasciclin (FAS1) repeats
MKNIIFITLSVILTALFYGCKKVEYVEETSDDVLIGAYFEQNSNDFSIFYSVLKKSGTLSFLNAYGTYTCFAPTNEAFNNFFSAKGKTSVDDFTPEELKDLVRYHVIIDTINSTRFTDGKLPSPTMYGQYLTARTYFEDGKAKTKINKYSEIETMDIRTANGIIHSIKSVLEPVTQTLAEMIEQESDYSIFTAALKETGLYDTLMLMPSESDEEKRWFTVMVPPDSVYNQEGIQSFNDLMDKYSDTGDPTNPADSLYLYVAYHCLDYSLKYAVDLVIEQSHLTMAPLEVITILLKGDTILINEEIFSGTLERGSPLDRDNSDNTCSNGVYHLIGKDYEIKLRLPAPVYFDVTDQPEIRKMPGVYRKVISVEIQVGQLADITWGGNDPVVYTGFSTSDPLYGENLVYSDFLDVNFRTAVTPWIEFKTPLVVKGKYKVWICTRNQEGTDRRPKFLVYINDEAMPQIIDNNYCLAEETDETLELLGFKRYVYTATDSTYYSDIHGRFVSQLAGTIELQTTARQVVKLVVINNGDKHMWIDGIQFLPYEMNQLWPRLDKNGQWIERPEGY